MDMAKTGLAIAQARKKYGWTQEQLAERIGVSMQAVSKWERGKNLPDIENLMLVAELTDTPYSVLLGEGVQIPYEQVLFRDRLFREENMFTRLRSMAYAEGLNETYLALAFMREQHMGQYRKHRNHAAEEVLYINHPLMMTCQAHAFGIRDDALLAAILLHDVSEDTGIAPEDLPFSAEVQHLVKLATFTIPEGMGLREAKQAYFEAIQADPKACIVKIIDRCNNLSTMAGTFDKTKMLRYMEETEEYILPMAEILKNHSPAYSDIAFLVKYQMISIMETIKQLLVS